MVYNGNTTVKTLMDSFQILMNAIGAQITAMLMLNVLTLLVASSVIVCLYLRAVKSLAQE